MTNLLAQAIVKLAQLPAEHQDHLAQVLIDTAESLEVPYRFTPKESEALDDALAEIEHGEFATQDEVAATWKRFGV